jgi:hypothetical protein
MAIDSYTDEDLENLSWEELLALREKAVGQQAQNKAANYEHQAYARDVVQENPLMAVPMAAMIPAYQVYKGIRGGARSQGGFEQMAHGYSGVLQGLLARMQR